MCTGGLPSVFRLLRCLLGWLLTMLLHQERRPKSLQQMFNDAQDIQHNIQACKQIQNEELDAGEHDSEYEQKQFI